MTLLKTRDRGTPSPLIPEVFQLPGLQCALSCYRLNSPTGTLSGPIEHEGTCCEMHFESS